MNSNAETILWAVEIGDEDWQEQIITTNANAIDKATKWAIENGFDRFRISTINPNDKPQFDSILAAQVIAAARRSTGTKGTQS